MGKRSAKLSEKTRRLRQRNKRGGFDAAASNSYTANHYSNAGTTDINSVIFADRSALVKRCCYEYRNNSYARGMLADFANEIVGSGPTLQMQTPNAQFNASVEARFAEYMAICDAGGDPEVGERMDFAEHLRVGLKEWGVRGEDLTNFVTDSGETKDEPQLRLLAISADRLQSPLLPTAGNVADGIKYNPTTGKPEVYYVQSSNPTSTLQLPNWQADEIPARDMIHTYLQDDAEQKRGFPLLAPALPLLIYLRRLTLAVVAAAEQAANISAVMKTQMGAVDAETVAAMDEIEIARNAILTLPAGYDIEQFKAEQPTSNYPKLKRELIAEVGRALMMPYIISGGDASGYNYSSGRLDQQSWWKAKAVIQGILGQRKCDRVLNRWLQEALLIPGYIKGGRAFLKTTPIHRLRRQWNWPGNEHVDPQKEANAEKTRLENGSDTFASIYSKKGKDWEREMEQRARELARQKELEKQYGVTLAGNSTAPLPEDDEEPTTAQQNAGK